MDLVFIVNRTIVQGTSQVYTTTMLEEDSDQNVKPFFKVPTDDLSVNHTLRNHLDIFGVYANGWIFLKKPQTRSIFLRSIYSLQLATTNHETQQQNDVTVYVITTSSLLPRKIFKNTTYTFTINKDIAVGSIIGNLTLRSRLSFVYIPQTNTNKPIKLDGKSIKTIAPVNCRKTNFDSERCRLDFPIVGVLGKSKESALLVINIISETRARFESGTVAYDINDYNKTLPKDLVAISHNIFNDNLQCVIISGNQEQCFTINSTSCQISILKPLTNRMYILRIGLLHTVKHQYNDTMELKIFNTIQEQPSFVNSTVSLYLDEDIDLGSIVYNLNLTSNPHLRYTMSLNTHFVTHPDLGDIQLIEALDYEQETTHHFQIYISNSTGHQLGSVDITVNVLNINDNAPTLNQTLTTITVMDNTTIGDIVFRCQAFDRDQDQLSYAITSDNKVVKQYFSLDTKTCSLKLIRMLQTFNDTSVKFDISISDGKHVTLLTVNLVVERVGAPIITSTTAVLVPDHVKMNQVIYRLVVKKVYKDTSVHLIKNYSGLFRFDQSTGELFITNQWPTDKFFMILPFNVTTKFQSTIFNLLLFRKRKGNFRFGANQYTRAISENQQPNYSLLHLKASYPIPSHQSNINYYITAGNHGDSFKINPTTGELIIKESLDYEQVGGRFLLVVHAVDLQQSSASTGYHTASTEVQVIIINLNDNAPVFEVHQKVVHVDENISNVRLVRVAAEDADCDLVRYSILSGNDNQLFSIIQDGWILLGNTSLDYEQENVYHLQIEATDSKDPALSSRANVTIEVINTNDNQPTFTQHQYFLDIQESLPIGSEIDILKATDDDSGSNGALYYKITSNGYVSSYFSIDIESGIIYLEKQLNCSLQCAFVLNVSVSDNGEVPRTSDTVVVINVQPLATPILNVDRYDITLSNDTMMGDEVLRINIKETWDAELSGYSKQMLYFLVDGGNNRFGVDENGTVFTKVDVTGFVEEKFWFSVLVSVKQLTSICTGRFEVANIHVTVNGIQEKPCYLQTQVFSVSEKTIIGAIIGELAVKYCSSGSDLTYTASTIDKNFQILNNGKIKLSQTLDFEERQNYTLQVIVQGLSITTTNTTQEIIIIVEDENDNHPVINDSSHLNVSIPTNITLQQVVFRMNASDDDGSLQNSQLHYRLRNFENLFRIDHSEGTIFVVNNTCFQHGELFVVNVSVADSGIPSLETTVLLYINVYEINTPPRFPLDIYNLTVKENVGPVTRFYNFIIYDDDKDSANRQVSFHISSQTVSGYFSIDESTGDLSLLRPFDYEEHTNMSMTVIAVDQEYQTAEATIFIIVEDVNDLVPVIVANQTGHITENSPVHTPITKVAAFDRDTGLNGKLKYSLVSHQISFKIDTEQGLLSSRRLFDYEIHKQFNVKVRVTDSAHPYYTAESEVVILINDANDSPPKFIGSTELFTPRATQPGIFLKQMEVKEADSKPNSKVLFSTNSTTITVNPHTGVVTANSIITKVFTFVVQVIDPTYPAFNDTRQITVKIANSMLFPPVEDRETMFVYVTENDARYMTEPLYTVDCGRCLPSIHHYVVIGPADDTSLFSLNSSNGVLKLNAMLDYESKSLHSIWIRSVDENYPNLPKYTNVLIYVLNINDNLPKFTIREKKAIEVYENVTVGSSIIKITATDADEGDEIFFFLQDDAQTFEINKLTGEITCTDHLDYELHRNYQVSVVATNNPILNATNADQDEYTAMLLLINVKNINDNAPIFQKALDTITVSEDFQIGTPFYRSKANDVDNLQPLCYGITNDSSHMFTINSATGELSLTRNLDRRERNAKLSVNITVTDTQYVTCHQLTVIVKDVNNSPPHFEKSHFDIKLQEKTKTCFHRFGASDLDYGRNSLSNIEMISSSDAVKSYFILYKNGSLCTRKIIKISGDPIQFQFTIKARNVAPPYFYTSVNVTVEVTDVNDHPPLFEMSNFTRYIPGDMKINSQVAILLAVDKFDINQNAMVEYSIFGGNGSSLFTIDRKGGHVRTKASLIAYIDTTLLLNIQANDLGSPSLSSQTEVFINVEGINKYSPQIFNGGRPYHVSVYENMTANQSALHINALDYESSKNLLFEITKGDPQSNWMVFNNGSLVLRSNLDYETVQDYQLVIKILDSSISNRKSIKTTVNVTIIDVNDVAPAFENETYMIIIQEDFNISKPLLTIKAVDVDPIGDPSVSYSIIQENQSDHLFTIDQNTGIIRATTSFDYEIQNSYTLEVKASDSGSPQLSNTTSVTIIIQGVNEHKPKFEFCYQFFNISRTIPIGSKMGRLIATDADTGDDGLSIYKSTLPKTLGLSVNILTGDLLVDGQLKAENYTFNALVMNKFKHVFYDIMQVNVLVYDFMGPPIFDKNLYQIKLFENATTQAILLRVSATYYDGVNGLTYGIGGEGSTKFVIDDRNGGISLASSLDYEIKKFYKFGVYATYTGSAKGFASVEVHVLDVNDNRPMLSNCSGNILENKPSETLIIPKLQIIDEDEFPNAAPFKFSLIDNKDNFAIDANTGAIRSTKQFDRETKEIYNIQINISDSGQPKLHTTAMCTILIDDVNDNYGLKRDVTIYATVESLKNNPLLGDMSPIDLDLEDKYNCSLIEPNEKFRFGNGSCLIYASAATNLPKQFSFQYLGQHKAERAIKSTVTAEVRDISPAFYQQPVAVFIPRITVEHFINTNKLWGMEEFVNKRIVEAYMYVSSSKMYVVSVQSFQDGIVVVMVTTTTDKFGNFNDIFVYHLEQNYKTMKNSMSLLELPSTFDACVLDPCVGSSQMVCKSKLYFMGFEIVDTPQVIFHSKQFVIQKQCRCQPGRVGLDCQKPPKQCSDNPCFGESKCVQRDNDINCSCPKSLRAKYCEQDVDECLLTPPTCQNGGLCVNKHGGYYCLCKGKYTGIHCEELVSPCSSSPCLNNATCSFDAGSTSKFKCSCRFGDWGSKCQLRSLNFKPASYIEVLHQLFSPTNYSFVMEFASVEKNALLHLTYSDTFSFICNIQNGRIRVSIATSAGKFFSESESAVSDGEFHLLEVNLKHKAVSMTIDEHSTITKSHDLIRYKPIRSLIYIGGIKDIATITKVTHQHLPSTEFIGCMRRLKINNVAMNSSKLLEFSLSQGVTVGCKRNVNACHRNLCGPGNECIDRWSHYKCRCDGGFISRNCLRDYGNVRLASGKSSIAVSLTESQRRLLVLKQLIRSRRSSLMTTTKQNNDGAQKTSSLSVSFRTRKQDGCLFNSTDVNGMTLICLSGGKIKYSFKTTQYQQQDGHSALVNAPTEGHSMVNAQASDGLWHHLQINLHEPTTISITLDSNHTTKHTFAAPLHKFVSLKIHQYIFGTKFLGCLGKVILEKQPLVLSSSSRTFDVISTSIEQGCIPTNVCTPNPCQNKSITNYCLDTWESHTCIHPGACAKQQLCKNNGMCIPEGGVSFSCDCVRTPFGGELCNIPLVCLQHPCQTNEQCLTDGPTFKCVTLETKSGDDSMGIGYVVATAVSVLFAIVIFAAGVAFLSSKRNWKDTRKENDVFRKGFENEVRFEETEEDGYNQRKPHVSKKSGKATNSLPDLRERPFSILKTRYKSADFYSGYDNYNEMYNVVTRQPREGVHLNRGYEEDDIPSPPMESGIESSYSGSEADERVSQTEMYDIECASMQFSEMSFNQDAHQPTQHGTMENIEEIEMMLRRKQQLEHEYTADSESSEAYFTCSESEYSVQQPQHRRGPGYVTSEHNPKPGYVISEHTAKPGYAPTSVDNIRPPPYGRKRGVSEASSITFSNNESTLSKKIPKRHKHQRRRSSNLRQKILSSSAKNKQKQQQQPENDIPYSSDNNSDQLWVVEEYV